jgi:phosphoesterase RecJ-like protein
MTQEIIPSTYDPKDLKAGWSLLRHAQNITLLTHRNPDADGIAACAALAHCLEHHRKHVEVIYPNQPEFPVAQHATNVFINTHKHQPDVIIIVDTATLERAYFPDVFKSVPLMIIDHHCSNNIKGVFNFVNPNSSSTCEELFVLIRDSNASLLDRYVAECLLAGILYDSQCFQTQLTSPRTLRIAAELVDKGANLFELKNQIFSSKTPHIISLWSKILGTVTMNSKKTAAWVCIRQADMKAADATPSSLAGFNNFLSQLCDIDVTVIFYEMESGQTKVSLRSRTTDVNKIAAHFGGGGHKNAAGIVSTKPFEAVVTEVTALLK